MHIALPQTAKTLQMRCCLMGKDSKCNCGFVAALCRSQDASVLVLCPIKRQKQKLTRKRRRARTRTRTRTRTKTRTRTTKKRQPNDCAALLATSSAAKVGQRKRHNFHTMANWNQNPAPLTTPPWLTYARGRVQQRSGIVHGRGSAAHIMFLASNLAV